MTLTTASLSSPAPIRRAITLKDVAAHAGVGAMSASAVLNGGRGTRYVAEEARERILRAAEDLGYRRNGSAATIKSGRFGSVALLLSTERHRSYVPAALVDGIHDELAAHNQCLMLTRLPDEKLTHEGFAPKILRELTTDGLLIDYIQHIPPELVKLVTRHHLPVVWINAKVEADCVYPNDWEAGERATEYLLKLGHRKIAWLDYSHGCRPDEDHYSARDRYGSYEKVMRAAGLAPRLMRRAQAIPHAERIAFSRECLLLPERPTAIISYGEPSPLMVAALAMGLRVPEDLSVMTFGDDSTNFAGIPVATMTEPNQEVGTLAVRMLLTKIQYPEQVIPPRSVPFDFQNGATCAPPPARQRALRNLKSY